MTMNKIKTGDEVIVLTGKDAKRRGRVLKIIDKKFAVVEGINIMRKHTKPNPNKNEQGGIIEREAPLALCKLALYNDAKSKGSRIGFKFLEDGKKVRYFKDSNEVIDV